MSGLRARVAETIAHYDPTRYTISLPKTGREQKILIDYLRNNRTNTSVAAFSTRATSKAPVSVPLAWDELSASTLAARYTVQTVVRRLASLRADPWEAYWTAPQTLVKDAPRRPDGEPAAKGRR